MSFDRVAEIKDSSQISVVSYDLDKQLLKVTFKNEASYLYSDVPRIHFASLVSSVSVGEYFNVNIKGKFAFQKYSSNIV